MHRSRSALSASIAILALARTAQGGAHEKPHYSLEDGTIVIEHDGVRDAMEADCDEPVALQERAGRLFVACGPSGVAVYGLDDPLHPALLERRPTHRGPCIDVTTEGACVVQREKIRTAIVSRAPREVVTLAACGLSATVSIGHRMRSVELVIDGKRCAAALPAELSLPVFLRFEDLELETRVVLEVEPEGHDEDVRDALAKISDELDNRIPRTLRAVEAQRIVPKRSWYGWQTLIVDGSMLAMGATVILFPLGILTYALGPAIVHWVHGHSTRGWISLAIRLGLPAVGVGTGTLLGFAVSCTESGGCGGSDNSLIWGAAAGTLVGGITGVISGPLVDALISYDDPPRTAVWPTLVPTDRGLAFGLGGVF